MMTMTGTMRPPMTRLSVVLFCIAAFAWIVVVDAFVPLSSPCAARASSIALQHLSASSRRDEDNDGGSDQQDGGIPQLPAIGSSSFDEGSSGPSGVSENQRFVGSKKFELQYTCNICETRNCHRVSRIAYRQGVVITRCKGCDSQHLIADNLGWTDYKGGFEGDINDIEDFLSSQGREVNRVSKEVFELEKSLAHDTKGGSIIGENGEPTME